MSLRIVCSGCRAVYQVPDNLLGKKVKCRRCEQVLPVTAPDNREAEPAHGQPAPTPELPPQSAAITARQEQVERSQPVASPRDEPATVEAVDPDSEQQGSAPPNRRRAARGDKEEAAPRKSPKRRSSPVLTLVLIVGLSFVGLAVLAGGGVGGWYLYAELTGTDNAAFNAPNPQPRFDGPAPPVAPEPLMERKEHLAAYFLTPEEPPLNGMEFTEPPPVVEQAPPVGTKKAGQLTPEVLQKIKQATVYLRVRTDEGESEGTGFFGVEPGVILTNAHVVGMLERSTPPPESIRVVRNKGERNESSFPARVVAVDRDADLALLSVPKEGMPEPLVVKSAQHLQETQSVYVAGFPLGELPGKSITINRYELSSLKKEKGVLDKLQVHGDMLPGNSGGPVLDAEGDVVGVCVSILQNTRINFAIPGDKVWRFLNGRLAALTLEPPARADDRLQVPVSVQLIDPLGRLRQARVDFWVGKPGPARPGSRVAPEPQPGDSPRETLEVPIQQQAGRGKMNLPRLADGQAYWLQPSLVNAAGDRVWLSAQVYRAPPAVERRPIRLTLKPAGERRLILQRWSSLQFADLQGRDHRVLVNLETKFHEKAGPPRGDEVTLRREFTEVREGVAIDGETYMTTRLELLGPNVRSLAANLVLDPRHTIRRDDIELPGSQPPPVRRDLLHFYEQTQKVLQGISVPLPGDEVQPGKTWKARLPLLLDPTWKVLQVLPAQIWGPVEIESLDVTYTYLGVRTLNGVEQAVIHLKGEVVRERGAGGSNGLLSGTAVVDPATGQVIEEEVTAQETLELVLFNTAVVKAQGALVARLRQE